MRAVRHLGYIIESDGAFVPDDFLPGRAARHIHRWSQPLFSRAWPSIRHRLQTVTRSVQREGPLDQSILLYRSTGRPGVLADPPARRLARLQRLHDGNKADEGIHRRDGAAPDQG